MAALSKHTNVKIFSEKLLLLLNRGGEGPGICGAPLPCPATPPPPQLPGVPRPPPQGPPSRRSPRLLDDPVRIFKHEPQPPHSVLKFLQDVFASPATAGIFYHTDMMALIDITVRHIADLSPGDKVPGGGRGGGREPCGNRDKTGGCDTERRRGTGVLLEPGECGRLLRSHDGCAGP